MVKSSTWVKNNPASVLSHSYPAAGLRLGLFFNPAFLECSKMYHVLILIHILGLICTFLATVQLNMKMVVLFMHPHVVPTLYEFLSYAELKRRILVIKTVDGPR